MLLFAKTSVMAKSSTRRVTIYINGKEVEASVKQIRSEMNKLVNEQNRMVIGSDEYISHAKKIKELRQYLKEHAQNIGSAASAWTEMYNKVLQFGTGIGGLTQILSSLDNVTSTLKQVATDLAAMDDVYSDVIKTTGMTREQVEELNESFKNLDTRTSREQLNNLAYIAGKLGISSKETEIPSATCFITTSLRTYSIPNIRKMMSTTGTANRAQWQTAPDESCTRKTPPAGRFFLTEN